MEVLNMEPHLLLLQMVLLFNVLDTARSQAYYGGGSMPGLMQTPQTQTGMMPLQQAMMPHMMNPLMQMGMPQSKIPVVVMPFHNDKGSKEGGQSSSKRRRSKKRSRRRHVIRRKKKKSSRRRYKSLEDSEYSDSDSSGEDRRFEGLSKSSERFVNHGLRRRHSRKNKRQVLTPVVSYISENGQVVYQKKIDLAKANNLIEFNKKSESHKDTKP